MIIYYQNDNPNTVLLLSSVTYNNDGSLKGGFVENGCWDFVIKNGECLAKDGGRIMNRWPLQPYTVKEVPKSLKGDYNDIINAMLEDRR